MKKPTLRDRLIKYLQNHEGWTASGELQRLAMNAGYTPQNAGRRLRECVEDGILSVEYRKPHNHAFYRYEKQLKTITDYKVENGVARAYTKTVAV